MGHKIKSCSYKNTAARNARALQKSQEGPKPLGVGSPRSPDRISDGAAQRAGHQCLRHRS